MRRGMFVQYTGPRRSVTVEGIFSYTLETEVFGHVLDQNPMDPKEWLVIFHPLCLPIPQDELKEVVK